MSAAFKAFTASVGKVVPSKLQPFWNHPAGCNTDHFSFYLLDIGAVLKAL